MLTSTSSAVIATNVALISLATSSVGIRLYTRKKYGILIGRDDHFMWAALFFSLGLAATNIIGVPVGGFGVPFESLSKLKVERFLKTLFALQFFYLFAIAFVKLSVLSFYARLFTANNLPLVFKIMTVITICWTISFFFATLFQVWPIWCNWVFCLVPTTNYTVMYVCMSVTDVVLDLAILCLPALFVRKLNLAKAQKVGILCIFGLGIFCIIASIARLIYAVGYDVGNGTSDWEANFNTAVVNMIMWSGIEASTSIIAANLPCYAPLLRFAPASRKASGVSSGTSRSAYSARSRSGPNPNSNDKYPTAIDYSNDKRNAWPSARVISTPYAVQHDGAPMERYLDVPGTVRALVREEGEKGWRLGLVKVDVTIGPIEGIYRDGRGEVV